MSSSNKPQIALLVSDPVPPNMEVVLFNLGRMVGKEFDLDIIVGPENDLRKEVLDLFDVYQADVCSRQISGLRYGFEATHQYLQERRPDLILNVSQPFPLGVAVVCLGKWKGVPSLLRITGDFLNIAPLFDSIIKKAWVYLRLNVFCKNVFRFADHIVAIGPNLAERLVCAGFSEEKVHAQYQPFDARRFSPIADNRQPELKADLGLNPSRKTILFVGRLNWMKGAGRLAEIIDRVLRRSEKYQFCLLGDGPDREVLTGYGSAVHAPGFVPHKIVHRYFQAADLLIHPSRTEGAVPHVVLEALGCGVPVIASPAGEIDNLVTMVTDNPDDYVEWILAGEEEWIRDSLPEHLNWERQSEQYKVLLDEAVGSRREVRSTGT